MELCEGGRKSTVDVILQRALHNYVYDVSISDNILIWESRI